MVWNFQKVITIYSTFIIFFFQNRISSHKILRNVSKKYKQLLTGSIVYAFAISCHTILVYLWWCTIKGYAYTHTDYIIPHNHADKGRAHILLGLVFGCISSEIPYCLIKIRSTFENNENKLKNKIIFGMCGMHCCIICVSYSYFPRVS